MFNQFVQYPTTKGIVYVRNRFYSLYTVFYTDNIRSKIKYCETTLSKQFPQAFDGRTQYEYLEMPNTDIDTLKSMVNEFNKNTIGLENVVGD